MESDFQRDFRGTCLIVGADGLVGSALRSLFADSGIAVTLTSRRPCAGTVHLDLRDPNLGGLAGAHHDVAFVCAAVTDMRTCQEDPDGSRLVNVTNTLGVLRGLAKRGTRSVFLSSSQVFDGETAEPDEDAPTCPKNEYGAQKVAVERAIREEGLPVAVLRVTKVMADRPVGVFQGWFEALLQGKPVHPATNMALSPVMVSDVAEAAARLGFARRVGIWHLGSRDAIGYDEAARLMAELQDLPEALVQGQALTEEQVPAIYRHRHVTLSCRKLGRELAMPVRQARDVLHQLFSAFGRPVAARLT
ncbi:MAG: sugar nucleotide-binding protein [Alphaproteobacteria bacterium]|nr:sugar nucleotide-binding protein [Alphaproteobacteria bacterium]MBV8408165.1 sugar nucleotide-binding protein [Alphaproteobacteria bacterium]